MGKSSPGPTTNTTQSSTSQPWAAAVPLLSKGIDSLTGQSTDVTSGQAGALSNLQTAAGGLPSFDTSGNIDSMLNFDTAPQMGILSDAYGSMKNSLSPLADPANLNPMDTPGLSDSLKTMTNDITNSVKGVYAGSGRDPTGAGSFAQSLGRGLVQGEAPILTGQYNANVGHLQNAATALESGGMGTAGAMTAAQDAPATEAARAISLIPQVQASSLNPAQAQLGAANTAYELPYTNILKQLMPALQLGALGTQTQSNGTQTSSQPQSAGANIMGGLMGGAGILSMMGGSGGGMGALASLAALSDERAKDDVEEIGSLHDGQKVYSFRYKGEPKTHMGLLAQEVLDHEPDAVHEHPTGLLMVDYGHATKRAAQMRRAA